jgi:hypothetical protein
LVELDATVVAETDLLAAVERGGREIAGEAADVDFLRAPTEALRGQAGQAGDRVGDRGVGQFADVFGRDRFDDRRRFAFGLCRSFDTAANTDHLDGVQVLGVFGCWVLRLVGRLRVGAVGQHQRRRRQCHTQQVSFQRLHGSPPQQLEFS